MTNKRPQPEEIITKLRQVEVLMGQGMARLDAIVIPPFFMGYICRLCSPFRLFQFHCGRYAADAHVGAIIVVCP